MRTCCFIFVLLFSASLHAQSLFEDAVSGDAEQPDAAQAEPHELNGYVRGVFYGGKVPERDEAEMKSGYGEAAIKLRVRKQDFGDGFAELRFRRGHEFNEEVSEVTLREAYVNMYVGRFDVRFGHQIVVWGRADGFNPTDTITPKNMQVRSPDEDDRRAGNFLIRFFCNLDPFRLEAIWIPVYAASVLPTGMMSLPPGMSLTAPEYPDANLKNSAFAVKLNLERASFDGSLSYFNGYNPSPGMDADASGIRLRAYKMHVAGADFSTTLGSYGFRGEFAYRTPHEDYEKHSYIPNPDLQIILGADRAFGDFSVILQYIGRTVLDFAELSEPQTPEERLKYERTRKNRMFSSQSDEISHAVSFRPAWKLLYETLDLEVAGLVNFTTEEFLVKPKVSYDIADALRLTAGGEFYSGPDGTLYDTMDETLSTFFVELKTSF
ncbi:MAG: hypothetical protein J7M27_10810 [Candidatus Latescibacteria bacterium]|nr:hypothetical protein [Candidatus Latescibacterota bacterium]